MPDSRFRHARRAGLATAAALVVVLTGLFASASPVAATSPPYANLESLTPNHGPSKGGNLIELRGYWWAGLAAVEIGYRPVEIIEQTAESAVVKAPAGKAGDVVKVTVQANSAFTSSQGLDYTYDPPTAPPVITKITPNKGYAQGNNWIQIQGRGLADVTHAVFGTERFEVTPASDTLVEIGGTPAQAPGKIDVRLENLAGVSANTAADDFTVLPTLPLAQITSITPSSGPQRGGQIVTIRGEHLATASRVQWNNSTFERGDEAVQVISDTELRVKTPVFGNVGPTSIDLWTDGAGYSPTDDAVKYTVLAPRPSLLLPGRGPTTGGNRLTIVNDEIAWDNVEEIAISSIGEVPIIERTDTSATIIVPPREAGRELIWVRTRSTRGSNGDLYLGNQLNGENEWYTWSDEPGSSAHAYTLSGTAILRTLTTGSFRVSGALDLAIDETAGTATGKLQFAGPSNARLTALGFLPVTASLSIVPSGTTTGTFSAAGLSTTTKVRFKVQNAKLFGAIPLIGGNSCQTKQLADLTLASAGAFDRSAGGRLSGTFAISDLNGCGSLGGLVSPATAGSGNTIAVDLKPRG